MISTQTQSVNFSQSIYKNLKVQLNPIADGKYHRFDDPHGKSNNNACWYRLSLYPQVFGYYGNWRTGNVYYFNDNKASLSPYKTKQALAKGLAEKERSDQSKLLSQSTVAKVAQALWGAAIPISDLHPYLFRKKIKNYGLKCQGSTLLVPIYDETQSLVNFQKIFPNGEKRFLKGGRIKGCYSLVGPVGDKDTIYLCEGWATGATIHLHTSMPVFCAMNCNNLLAVGRHIKENYPKHTLVIAGDDDRLTKGNPGKSAALSAALALKIKVIFPSWHESAPLILSDFNDQHCYEFDEAGVES